MLETFDSVISTSRHHRVRIPVTSDAVCFQLCQLIKLASRVHIWTKTRNVYAFVQKVQLLSKPNGLRLGSSSSSAPYLPPPSGRRLLGAARLPADKKGAAGAGGSHQVQHGEVRLGLHGVRVLLRTGGSGLAPRQGGLVRFPRASFHCSTPPGRPASVCGNVNTLVHVVHLCFTYCER